MDFNDILSQLDILSETDFHYPEQFIALMETDTELDYDTFAEIIMMASTEDMPEMISTFFEDLIRGIPDDNTDLYSSVQNIKDILLTLSAHMTGRGAGFFTEELFKFRSWYKCSELIKCTPEEGGSSEFFSPFEAMMLYREERLSGKKYIYDFASGMPEEPDEYISDIVYEFETGDDSNTYCDDYDEFYDLPEELPEDFDPAEYDPTSALFSNDFDPYRDGLIDRFAPVIEKTDLSHKKVKIPPAHHSSHTD